jgi:hypothetical protein
MNVVMGAIAAVERRASRRGFEKRRRGGDRERKPGFNTRRDA